MKNIGFILIISFISILSISYADVTIFPTQTAKLNTTGISGNVFQVTYTWYNECPTCSTYNSFANSNSLVYYWVTNSATQLGTWKIFVGAVDSTGANSVNSVTNNVMVISSTQSLSPPSVNLYLNNNNNIGIAALAIALLACGLALGGYVYNEKRKKNKNT